MNNFYDRPYDVLLATDHQSGLDIPNAKPIHRADMFGLSQLYQLPVGASAGRSCAATAI